MHAYTPFIVTRDKFLSQDEVARLYAALEAHKAIGYKDQRKSFYVRDYYILRLLLETGLRVFELVSLKVSDFREGSLIVRRGKGGKPRNILLTDGTKRLLDEYLLVKASYFKEALGLDELLVCSSKGIAYSTRGIRKRVKYWFKKLGFSDRLSCHSARHSYISHLIAAGVDLPTVRDNAGHSSLAITSIYAHAVRPGLGPVELYRATFSSKRNWPEEAQQKIGATHG